MIKRGKKDLCTTLSQQHRDDILLIDGKVKDTRDNNQVVDDIVAIHKVDQLYIHLVPTSQPTTLNIEAHYRRLDKPEIIEKAMQSNDSERINKQNLDDQLREHFEEMS